MDKTMCEICAMHFETDIEFHRHLRKHKITQTEYYQKFYPRYDRFDHSIIKFKSKEYYFNTEFNNRANLKLWIESVTPELAKGYIKTYLRNRKDNKGMVYAPTQIELRSLMVPGMKYIISKIAPYGNYNLFCNELGFLTRFKSTILNKNWFEDVSKKVIFTDSREQTPLKFNNTTRKEGLSFGDYRMSGSDVYIERKSLGDCWGTLSGGYERFEREIIRAKEANAYLIILIESAFGNLEKFPSQKQVYGKIKLPIEFIYHNIRILLQKYQHIQFLFVNGRDDASRIVEKIFSAGEQVKNIDLQFQYDSNLL